MRISDWSSDVCSSDLAIAKQITDKPGAQDLRLPSGLKLKSSVVLVVDQKTNEVLAAQHADSVQPIASLTKLMTALVVTDAKQPMDEVIEITRSEEHTSELQSLMRISYAVFCLKK